MTRSRRGSLDMSNQIAISHAPTKMARAHNRRVTASAGVRAVSANQSSGANNTISVIATYMP
jgi:hypothetical protein